MPKRLEIQIALDDLEFLKANKYLLCFATGIQSEPAVVWRCFSGYLENNPISWFPLFQVFGTSSLVIGNVVTIDTNAVAIALGQQTTLSANAVFQPPVAGGMDGSISIDNQYAQQIHLGISQALTGPDNVQQTTPFFVAPAGGPGEFTFTPVDSVRVWLQPDVVTGAIISSKIPNSIVVDLITRDLGKLQYQGGKWTEQSVGR